MSRSNAVGLGLVALLGACSTIVGADFDDRHERTAHGGASATGGTAGSANGGTTQAGAKNSGGTQASGGSSNEHGGSSNGGALSFGGTAPIGGGGSGGTAGADDGGNAGAGQGGSTAMGGVGGEAGLGGMAGGGGSPEGGAAGSAPVGTPDVVLNEVKGQGSGDDYVELYNRGSGTLALEGYGISDSNNTFIFPAGASLAPKQYVLLLLGQTAVGGTYTCYTPAPCYHATWGISQNGENVYFRGRQNQVLDMTLYPSQSASGGLTNEQTWGRYPNGTGSFAATRRTPEAENLLP